MAAKNKRQSLLKSKLLRSSSKPLIAVAALVAAAAGFGLYSLNSNHQSRAIAQFNCPVIDYQGSHVHPTQYKGFAGECVKHLQDQLNIIHFFHPLYKLPKGEKPLAVDGIFGDKTKARLLQFQLIFDSLNPGTAGDLVVDGIAGPETWSRIHSACQGATGDGNGCWHL